MTVDLYRRNDAAPAPLPAVAYTSAGLSRTDLANQPDSRKELGFVFFATIDPATQQAIERDGQWVVQMLPPDPVAVTAGVVTMRQAKLALRRAGLLAKANAAIEAMEGDAGEDARIEWTSTGVLRRDHPLVAGIGQALWLDDTQIDTLFAQAAAID